MPLRIYNASFFGRIRDAFDLKGKHDFKLDEVIVPVVLVEDLATESSSEPNDATWIAEVAPDALGASRSVLENSGVGVRILIDTISMSSNVPHLWRVRLSSTAPVLPIAGGQANKTWNNANQVGTPPGTFFADRGVFVGNLVWTSNRLGNAPEIIQPKLVLDPGQSVVVEGSVVNSGVNTVFRGRVASIV